MKNIKTKIKDFLDERQSVLYQDHEREYAAKKLFEMFERELQKITPKQTTLKQIEQYKSVLKLAKVPKIIIENPAFIKSMPLTKENIEWAKVKIAEYQEYFKFQKKQIKPTPLSNNEP